MSSPPAQPGFKPTQPPPAGYPHAPTGYPNPLANQYAPGGPPPYQSNPPMAGGEGYPLVPPTYGGNHPPQGGPVVTQPTADPSGWMSIPQGLPNCPRGLEYLTMIDQLLVQQKVELLEAFVGFETKNKFAVKNSLGQKVYFAAEDSDCCTRNCLGPMRCFDMKIYDNFQNEVIHMYRPLACQSCCFPCCLQTLEVSSPPGTVIGTVEQEWSIFCPTFAVKDASGQTVLRIEGPCLTCSFCGDVDFKIMALDGTTQVGKISKQWTGLVREAFTDADNFGISFPIDLDVKMKAVMLGACFLIDAMFFERTNN